MRSVITLFVFLVVAAPAVAQYWCAGDVGTLSPATTFAAADVCPREPGDKLKRFPVTDIQAFILTEPFQLSPGETVEIRGYAAGGSSILRIEEHLGPRDGMLLTIADDSLRLQSADGNTSKILGHVDVLPTSCILGSIATRIKPLTFPDTAQLCVCKQTDVWSCLDLP